MALNIYNIHQPIYNMLIKFIKGHCTTCNTQTHRIQQRYKRNNAQRPLCNRQRTLNLRHRLYNVQYAIYKAQLNNLQ